jgi:DNA-binding transcriptional MerR regulator
MKKGAEAFRTISEVSDLLETPAHVLRFWESKFYQIRPVKRAGGRRYYRPDDVALINGIRLLLQDGGLTIRGVQRILQEKGVRHLIEMGSDLPVPADASEGTAEPVAPPAPTLRPGVVPLRPAWPLQIMPEQDETDTLPVDAPANAALAPDNGGEQTAAPASTPGAPPAKEPPPARSAPVTGQGPGPVPDTAPPEPPEDPGSAAPRLPHALRTMSRDLHPNRRDQIRTLTRRMDALLDRMSDASGAGRW